MSKMCVIKITKADLIIPEAELLRHLPDDVIEAALRRGKAIKRHQQQQDRLAAKRLETMSKGQDIKPL